MYLVVGLDIELDLLARQGSHSVGFESQPSARERAIAKRCRQDQRAAGWRGSFYLLDKHGCGRGRCRRFVDGGISVVSWREGTEVTSSAWTELLQVMAEEKDVDECGRWWEAATGPSMVGLIGSELGGSTLKEQQAAQVAKSEIQVRNNVLTVQECLPKV